jgi:hypothetical protein
MWRMRVTGAKWISNLTTNIPIEQQCPSTEARGGALTLRDQHHVHFWYRSHDTYNGDMPLRVSNLNHDQFIRFDLPALLRLETDPQPVSQLLNVEELPISAK